MKFCPGNPHTEILASSPSAGQCMINMKSIINIGMFNYNDDWLLSLLKEKSVFFLKTTQNELF